MKMRDLHIEKKKDKVRIEYIATEVTQEELDRLATILYTGEVTTKKWEQTRMDE